MRTTSIFGGCGVLLFALSTSASAQVSKTYFDRATFTAAANGLSTVTFNNAVGDDRIGPTTTFVESGVTFSGPAIYNVGPAFGYAPGNAYGSGYLEWGNGNNPALTITLSSAYTAVGFDFEQINGTSAFTRVAINGVNYTPQSSNRSSFFGYTTDTPFSSLTLTLVGGPADTIDNFSFGTATALPEPATWAMMLAGFWLIGGAMRRRREVRFACRAQAC